MEFKDDENVKALFPPEPPDEDPRFSPVFLERERYWDVLDDRNGQFISDARHIQQFLYPFVDPPEFFNLPMAFEPCLDDKTIVNQIRLSDKDHFSLSIDPDHFYLFMNRSGAEPGSDQATILGRYYVATAVARNYLAETAKQASELFKLPDKLKLKPTKGGAVLSVEGQQAKDFTLWQMASSIALRVVTKRDVNSREKLTSQAKEYGSELWIREVIDRMINMPEKMLPILDRINYWEYFIAQDVGLANPLPGDKLVKYAPFLMRIANR